MKPPMKTYKIWLICIAAVLVMIPCCVVGYIELSDALNHTTTNSLLVMLLLVTMFRGK